MKRLIFFWFPIISCAGVIIWFLYIFCPKPKYQGMNAKVKEVDVMVKVFDQDNYLIRYCYVGLEKSKKQLPEKDYLFIANTIINGVGRLGSEPVGEYDIYVWLGGWDPLSRRTVPRELAYIGFVNIKEDDQEIIIKLTHVNQRTGRPEKDRKILIVR